MLAAILLALGEELVLRDKAGVAGRFVTLLEVVEADKLAWEAREALKFVYLGRTPESGERTITAEEIRKELLRRGMDHSIKGEKVVVKPEAESTVGECGREALAFELKCHLVAARRMKAGEFSVRITFLEPEKVPSGYAVTEVRPRDASDFERAEFDFVLENPEKKRMTVYGIARILAIREVAFATRDLTSSRLLVREDFELRRSEVEHSDRYMTDIDLIVGSKTVARIAKGAPIVRTDIKLKPTIRRHDVVRAKHKFVEADARAVDEGAVGEVIWLEYAATGHRFQGRVVSAREVEVIDGGKK